MTREDRPTELGIISVRASTWWTAATFLGIGMFTFPRAAVIRAGTGAIYPILASLVVVAAVTWFIPHFMQKHPGRTFVQVVVTGFGWAGRIFALFMGVVMILTLAASYRFVSDVVRQTLMQNTPVWAITAAIAVVVGYLAWLGLMPLSRTVQLISPIFLFTGLTVFAMTMGSIRFYFLIPHWTGWTDAMQAFVAQFFIFAGLQNLHIFHAFVGRARTGKTVLAGFLVNVLILVFLFVGAVGTFGIDALHLIAWPAPFVAKSVSLHGFYIRKIGVFSILDGIGWVVMFLGITSFSTAVGLAQVVGLGARGFRWLLPVVVVIPAVLAIAAPNEAFMLQFVTSWLALLTMFMVLVEPLLIWVAGWVVLRREARGGRVTS